MSTLQVQIDLKREEIRLKQLEMLQQEIAVAPLRSQYQALQNEMRQLTLQLQLANLQTTTPATLLPGI